MMSAFDEPFGQLTEEAELFELPDGDMEEILPPFEAGLTMAAGRALAVLAYRDAVAFGDEPFTRDAPAAAGTVLALLPEACDRLDREFRAAVARALWDLADDLAAGRAPLPRCAAEEWALNRMLEAAPAMFAATDEELHALGVAVPEHPDTSGYRPPYWEEAWQLIVEGAKYSIAEAQPAAGPREDAEDGDVPEEPAEGWDAPCYWFSLYSFIRPRDLERGHPDWAQRHLDGGALAAPQPLTGERAAVLLHLDSVPRPGGGALDGDEQDAAESGRGYFGDDRDGVLTPLAARLLAAAADQVAEAGWHDLLHHGDRVFERLEDEDDELWLDGDSFLGSLPPLCDGQGAAWRLAMVGAVKNLADDLRAGRTPNASCTAEELALHLIVGQAKMLVDLLDDEDYAEELGLPTADQISVRHRAFDLVLEYYLQDFDVLMHYDSGLSAVVTDPEHPANLQMGIGDLRPRAWFEPFGNTRPRPPRLWEPWLLDQISGADPAAFFASTPALVGDQESATGGVPAAELPSGLRKEFETFVGLAQRRFFDEPTAIAMAAALERLLTLFFSTPSLAPHSIWPLNPRATAVHAGWLLVDPDFCLQGLNSTWRLSADRTDHQARVWACELLLDCANYALANHHRQPGAYPRGTTPPAPLDPGLAATLEKRLTVLSRDMTTAGTLHHRMTHLGLSPLQLAQAAILPEPVITAWLAGDPASPSQLIRCAPALQMSEDTLLDAIGGKRDHHHWPLPEPALDRLGHPAPEPPAAHP
ncbi:hypothetical protein PV726_32060 [Streptomyces europaeiscabiei]|uniref:hypothetical protein n=1 Tax=Streptomyces europaeiscabiei TaxID=146819 RepID=UPI0029AE5503|nr:hypothetical protein [Streptomyces europaeiscabiei]MDX3694891.1 hypothetical protein [Streptomyces europaeiscabiei]